MTLEETLLFDFELNLEEEAVSRAIALSQTIPEVTHRWSAYLALLALEGFTSWIESRSTPIEFSRQRATLIEAQGANGAAAITQLLLNQFRVCLVVLDDPKTIDIPMTVIDRPSQRSHFYIAISIHEEDQQISLSGFLRSDQFNQYRQNNSLIAGPDQTYRLPLSIFEPDFDQLLLYAAALEPNALPLPMIQLSSAVLQFKQRLVQPMVQAGNWIQQQVDLLANEAWTLTAPLSPAIAMRSSRDIPTLQSELERRGIQVPTESRAAYQDVLVGDRLFRLHVIVWANSSERWSLVAILNLTQPASFPNSVRLTIEQNESVVAEDSLSAQSPYLVVQAEGKQDEKFGVAIALDTGDSLTLPPFTYS